jgi:hypothetical protein
MGLASSSQPGKILEQHLKTAKYRAYDFAAEIQNYSTN